MIDSRTVAAAIAEDLDLHVDRWGSGEQVSAIVSMLVEHPNYPRERLAALLATALVRLAGAAQDSQA